jgi:hypothetical protein
MAILMDYYLLTAIWDLESTSVNRVFEALAVCAVFLLLTGMFATQRAHLVVVVVIANFYTVAHLVVFNVQDGPLDEFSRVYYWVLSLFILNIGSIGAVGIHQLFRSYALHLQSANEARIAALTKVIEGLLSMCASCKSIREGSEWVSIERFLTRCGTDVEFTHGLCPKCIKKLYPDLELSGESTRF